jgi:hypothetical protein
MPQLDKINMCSNDAFLCKNEIFFDHCISATYISTEKTKAEVPVKWRSFAKRAERHGGALLKLPDRALHLFGY